MVATANFIDRWKGTEEEARGHLMSSSNAIRHLLINKDGTFSIMSHIVCEWCDYCDDQGDCRGRHDVVPVKAKPNAYERQEWYEPWVILVTRLKQQFTRQGTAKSASTLKTVQ